MLNVNQDMVNVNTKIGCRKDEINGFKK